MRVNFNNHFSIKIFGGTVDTVVKLLESILRNAPNKEKKSPNTKQNKNALKLTTEARAAAAFPTLASRRPCGLQIKLKKGMRKEEQEVERKSEELTP